MLLWSALACTGSALEDSGQSIEPVEISAALAAWNVVDQVLTRGLYDSTTPVGESDTFHLSFVIDSGRRDYRGYQIDVGGPGEIWSWRYGSPTEEIDWRYSADWSDNGDGTLTVTAEGEWYTWVFLGAGCYEDPWVICLEVYDSDGELIANDADLRYWDDYWGSTQPDVDEP
jgi:hypothetical protein